MPHENRGDDVATEDEPVADEELRVLLEELPQVGRVSKYRGECAAVADPREVVERADEGAVGPNVDVVDAPCWKRRGGGD